MNFPEEWLSGRECD